MSSTHGQQPPADHGFAPQGPVAYQTHGGGPAGPGTPMMAPPQPPKKSWFARHKFLSILLAIVAVIVLANIVSSGDDDTPPANDGAAAADTAADTADDDAADDAASGETGEEADAAPAADVEPEPEPDAAPESVPGIGEAVRDGKFEFTVTKVETGVTEVGNEYFGEEAQGQFVLVHLTVSNVGDEAQMLSGSNQTLVDSEGRQHSANSSAAIYLEDSKTFINDINPGNSVDGIVVFDIPADAEPASIELHDSMFSGGVMVSLD